MATVLVTGSNRGMGLEWVRQCAARDWRVFATCRDPEGAAELQALAGQFPGIGLHRLDVTAPNQIADLARGLADETLDLLVNNAGVYFEHWCQDPIGGIDYDAWQETFRVNTLGAMRVTESLLPCLSRAKRPLVLAISSNMGSIAGIASPGTMPTAPARRRSTPPCTAWPWSSRTAGSASCCCTQAGCAPAWAGLGPPVTGRMRGRHAGPGGWL